MKTEKRFITLVRLGLTVAVLGMLGALPAARALEELPVEAKEDGSTSAGRPPDCAAAANGSCSGGFTLTSTDLTGVSLGSSVAWGDYDDDGDLDILLAGYTGSTRVTELWRNDGGDTFTQVSTPLTGVARGDVAWGDYDDDGDLDILLSGYTGSARVTEVWRNDGGGTFVQASTAPTGVYFSSVAWGDYDDDGDLDILLAGHMGNTNVTELWRNEGGDTFIKIATNLTGVNYGDVSWGDYDSDGDLDILLAGNIGGTTGVTEVWRNNGGGYFTLVSSDPTGVYQAGVDWGDYDDDGDLDILLAGYTGIVTRTAEVWRNDGSDTFIQASAAPTDVGSSSVAWGDYDDDGSLDILLAGEIDSAHVTEVWRNSGGVFTLASSDPTDVFSGGVDWGDYDDDGDLDILLAGATSGSTRVTEVWRNETCRCSGRTFTLASANPTDVGNSSVAWGDYDNDGDLDILLAGVTVSATWVTEVWRNYGSGIFTLASSDPTGVTFASVAWGDYDDDGDLDILLAGYADSGHVTEVWRNDGGDSFALASSDPTGVSQGGVAWGDYDDDGDLDILLAGLAGSTRVAEVWRNDGSDIFTQSVTSLTGVIQGGVAWGDYDDDGDLDILLAGYAGSDPGTTEVWRNDGGDSFVLASSDPSGIAYGNVAWGDYDDDGDLDILLTGNSGGSVTEVWRNDGGDSFALANGDPTGVTYGDVAWGDYDDDGDLDILLAGDNGSGYITEVWRNDGGAFALASAAPTGVYDGSVAWGDYDDDGDLDILLAGGTGSSRVTEVWRSECLETFLPLVLRNLP